MGPPSAGPRASSAVAAQQRPNGMQPDTEAYRVSDADSLPSTYASGHTNSAGAAGRAASRTSFGAQPQHHLLQQQQQPQQQQQDAADAAMYRDMRQALADFDAQRRKLESMQASSSTGKKAANAPCSNSSGSGRPARMPPRQTAFYSALRSVLHQVLAEASPTGRHTRLVAVHAWYVGHRPRPVAADPGLAAALAASLSISTPGQQQQQQQQQQQVALVGAGMDSSRPHSAGAVDSEDSDCVAPDSLDTAAGSIQQKQQWAGTFTTTAAAAAAAAAGGGGGEAGTSSGRPNSAVLHAQRLDAAAQAAFVTNWPCGSSGRSGRGGCAGSHAAGVPGLIPVGCLPSSRVAASSSASPSAAAAAAGGVQGPPGALPGSCRTSGVMFGSPQPQPHQQQQQQQQLGSGSKATWSAVMAQQAAVEAEVAHSMHHFARQRARTEEDISRRQELAAVAAATAAAAAAAAAAAVGAVGGTGGCAGVFGVGCGPPQRLLQHLDSQHQPSSVSAELALTAVGAGVLAGNLAAAAAAGGAGGGGNAGSSGGRGVSAAAALPVGPQLVVPDRVKAARKQHLAAGLQECSVLQGALGLPEALLARALLPPPDVPYMSAFAQLLRFEAAAGVGGGGKKKKKKKTKKKSSKGDSTGKQSKKQQAGNK